MEAPAVTAVPLPPERQQPGALWRWFAQLRIYFRQVKRELISNGELDPRLWKPNAPNPTPNWIVNDERRDAKGRRLPTDGLLDCHSDTERIIYRTLQAIAHGKLGRFTKAKSRQVGPGRFLITISHSEAARVSGVKRDAWSRGTYRLDSKHSIKIWDVEAGAPAAPRKRSEKGPANRRMKVYLLLPYEEVLAARAADPRIGHDLTPEGKPRFWAFRKRTSCVLLTPEQIKACRIDVLPADDQLPELPQPRKGPKLVPAKEEKPELSEVDQFLISVGGLDDQLLQVPLLARRVASERGTTINDAEILVIVQGMAEQRRDKRTGVVHAEAGYFTKRIEGATRLYLRMRLTEEMKRQRKDSDSRKAEEQNARAQIRLLLLSRKPEDSQDLHEYWRNCWPDLVMEVEHELGLSGGGGGGGGGSGGE